MNLLKLFDKYCVNNSQRLTKISYNKAQFYRTSISGAVLSRTVNVSKYFPRSNVFCGCDTYALKTAPYPSTQKRERDGQWVLIVDGIKSLFPVRRPFYPVPLSFYPVKLSFYPVNLRFYPVPRPFYPVPRPNSPLLRPIFPFARLYSPFPLPFILLA